MKCQNSESQKENPKNLSNDLEKRKLTPEEISKMTQEAEASAKRYREYMKKMKAMEKQEKETK